MVGGGTSAYERVRAGRRVVEREVGRVVGCERCIHMQTLAHTHAGTHAHTHAHMCTHMHAYISIGAPARSARTCTCVGRARWGGLRVRSRLGRGGAAKVGRWGGEWGGVAV